MFYAELIDGHKVRCVGGGPDYTILPPNSVEITEGTEVQEGWLYVDGLFRAPTAEEIAAEGRPAFNARRSRLFAETEWVRERHEDHVALGIDDAANWTVWLEYWQALRDLPETEGFDPRNPEWPVRPE